jgi:hypothetical protein
MEFEFVIDDADKISWDEWIGIQHNDYETGRNVMARFMVRGVNAIPEQEARRLLGALPTSKMTRCINQFTETLQGMASNPRSDNS